MEFICIVGNRGSGKTCLLTKYLSEDADAGRPVIANYHLKFPHRLMSFDEIRKLPPEIEGATIGMDELGEGADSYEFLSKDVKAITTLITQIRKRHCRVIYTVQRFSLIARRLRLQTDGFIFMEDLDSKNMRGENGDSVELHREVCKGMFRATYVNADRMVIRRVRVFNGRPYWKLYNTDEIIWG